PVCPVQSLKICLFLALQCRKPHCWPRSCLSNGLRIDDVGLVRLYVGLHKLRRDQAHLMSERLYLPGHPLRSSAGLHPHDRRCCSLEELQKRVASETNLLDWRAVASETDDMEYVLADIDSVDCRGARHIALWHCNLLRFDSLMMRQEDEADHPINGSARRQATGGRLSQGDLRDERAAGV